MTGRDTILDAVRRNLPRPTAPLPEIPGPELGRDGTRADGPGPSVLQRFRTQLEEMGGRSFDVVNPGAACAKLAELFPDAKVVCSAVHEVPGTRRITDVRDPYALNDVDVGVVRSPLAVAEAGAIWLTQGELVVNALGVLSQHLVVLLDPGAVVETLHDAYGQVDLGASPYGLFMAGPSATGDIEGVLIHGAQGARTLTVLLLADTSTGDA